MTDDPVNPRHYAFPGGVQVADITDHLCFNRGSAIKYLARAGRKDPSRELEDLEKALWYVNREIELVRSRQADKEES